MRFARFAIGSTIGYGTVEGRRTPPRDHHHAVPAVGAHGRGLRRRRRCACSRRCSRARSCAIGLNYRAHAEEQGKPLPEEPLLFLKPSTSVIGPGDTIVMPPQSQRVDHEAELAVVIGRATRRRASGGRARARARLHVRERRHGA